MFIAVASNDDSTAWTTNNCGAINKKVNSIGSVTPLRTAVRTTGIISPAIFFLFSGRAVL